jgi:hypothetical protein
MFPIVSPDICTVVVLYVLLIIFCLLIFLSGFLHSPTGWILLLAHASFDGSFSQYLLVGLKYFRLRIWPISYGQIIFCWKLCFLLLSTIYLFSAIFYWSYIPLPVISLSTGIKIFSRSYLLLCRFYLLLWNSAGEMFLNPSQLTAPNKGFS